MTTSLVLLLYSHPALNGYLVEDHCHGDICGPHWFFMPTSSTLSSGVEIGVIAAFLLICIIITRQSIKGHNYKRLLKELTDKDNERPYRIVKSNRITAWCAGVWEPEIYMTQGLIDKLSQQQVNLVWAHEHCHAVNHDNLRKSLVHWLTLHWPNKLKRTIRRDFSDQLELSCDLAAIHGVIAENNGAAATSVETVAEFEQTINLLAKHCSRDEPLDERKLKLRVELLNRELKKIDEINQLSITKSWLLAIASIMGFVLWVITVAGLLHPILELLSA